MELQHIGYCGVDCAACSDRLSGKCPDCRRSIWPEGDPCLPIACCRGKGIACCGQCAGFPCPDMAAFYAESESHRAAFARMRAVSAQKQEADRGNPV